uniref:Uncharacterized protein n=1 Tax=Panagrolaimus davidi TaxID=227884 RepID=A0A914QDB8_9BILA
MEVQPDKTGLCEIPNNERMTGNYITKVIINRKEPFESDRTIQSKFLNVFQTYVGIPSEHVLFLIMKCVANDPNLIEIYFAVKLLNHPTDKFYFFKDNYYQDFSGIHEQTELNIVAIKIEKNQIINKTIPEIISKTIEPKSVDFNQYGIYIYTFIFLSAIILFIGCWASKDLSKWYELNEEKQKDLEMFMIDSTTSTSTLQP